MDPNNRKPRAPGEDNISDSRDHCISDTSSTDPGNVKLIFSLLFSSCWALVTVSCSLVCNSNCRIQIFAPTRHFLPSLSHFLPISHFLKFTFFVPPFHTHISTNSYVATSPIRVMQHPENGIWLTEAQGWGWSRVAGNMGLRQGGRNRREM